MRLSASVHDEAYHPQSAQAKVTLDGAELRDCITADEEHGLAVCYSTDADGRFMADGDEFRTVNHRGVVKIELPANWIADAVIV